MTRPRPQSQAPSCRNHYVPVWYQLGFQVDSSANWLADISVPRLRPDGSPIVLHPRQRPAKSSFWEDELYVTRLGEAVNDEIETVLFQEIDNSGSDAVRAFIEGDEQQMHHLLGSLLSYLGAQKLRTPKGLAWIRSRYPALSQAELLTELQHLRNMFGALWGECVREIVSAHSSQVKFMVTDHPVTMFNAELPRDAPMYADPLDPSLMWNGTQTLFALDANNLLILTHVPYAKDPASVDALARRVNARYFGDTLLRTDVLIRSRHFTSDQVVMVNSWLKARARRYIAAADREWLNPDSRGRPDVRVLAELFRPPADHLCRYGGEVYIGYQDGTYGYRDQYGRTSREHEAVAKRSPTSPPSSESACPCGSGDVYGACCERRPIWDRASWNVRSLRERNLMFVSALRRILDIDETPWKKVQRELSDEQVREVHLASQSLWPTDTEITALLPRRDSSRTTGLYMGLSDPRLLGENILALSPLFDRMLVMDPFMFPRNMKAEYSPTENPNQHKQQFLKNAVFWLSLAPFIAAGKVLVFPDPGEVNPQIGRAIMNMARERTDGFEIEPAEYDEMSWLAEEDAGRAMKRMPDEFWLDKLRPGKAGMSHEEASEVIAFMRAAQEDDPLALLQSVSVGDGGQFLMMRAVNVEVGLLIAQITGATVVTDVSATWRQLHIHTRATDNSTQQMVDWRPLHLDGLLEPHAAITLSQSEEAIGVKTSMSTLRAATDQQADHDTLQASLDKLQERLSALSEAAGALPPGMARVRMSLTPSTPLSGFESPTVQRLVVSLGSEDAPVALGLALFRRTERGGQTARSSTPKPL